jgi:oxepin-CoA hydrolase/3-oxo-5,6-dehydrosuberyl-CoA semialdehyde dehydrogenase
VQLVSGDLGDLLDRLDGQDVVSFTGSAATALMLRSRPLLRKTVRFVAEQDSLNATILGPDAVPDTPEFDLFVKEAHREMTAKAGQKCTAIRRIIVPQAAGGRGDRGLSERLAKNASARRQRETTRMGALISPRSARTCSTRPRSDRRGGGARLGDPDAFDVDGADPEAGAFLPPMLLPCDDPDRGGARP